MLIRYCDRCLEKIPHYGYYEMVTRRQELLHNGSDDRKVREICYDCMEKLDRFIDGRTEARSSG